MFPIVVKFTQTPDINEFKSDYKKEVLEFFKQEFKNRKADNVAIVGNEVTFKNRMFRFGNNWNIMVPVYKGKLKMERNFKGQQEIEYTVSFLIVWIIAVVIPTVFGFMTKNWQIALLMFFWIGGVNWLIGVIRHQIMFKNLCKKIAMQHSIIKG